MNVENGANQLFPSRGRVFVGETHGPNALYYSDHITQKASSGLWSDLLKVPGRVTGVLHSDGMFIIANNVKHEEIVTMVRQPDMQAFVAVGKFSPVPGMTHTAHVLVPNYALTDSFEVSSEHAMRVGDYLVNNLPEIRTTEVLFDISGIKYEPCTLEEYRKNGLPVILTK